jgi:hypothetical protein
MLMGDPKGHGGLICDEEIAEAIKLILKNRFATFSKELVLQSSRFLGFRATSEMVANRIDYIIKKMMVTTQPEIPVLVVNACMRGIIFLMFRKHWAVHIVSS